MTYDSRKQKLIQWFDYKISFASDLDDSWEWMQHKKAVIGLLNFLDVRLGKPKCREPLTVRNKRRVRSGLKLPS
jgi:hypothetical protein